MAFKQPDTALNLYRDIPIADGLQLAFQSTEEQATYFRQRIVRQVTAMTHINNTRGSVRISGETRDVLACNYLSFNNVAFEGKPMYAQITNADQINHSTIEVFFEIDWWQTFMFDAQYRPSMIERQHLSLAQHAAVKADPYRNDIPELLTSEDLVVSEDLEVSYQRSLAHVTETGEPAGRLGAAGATVVPAGHQGVDGPGGQKRLVQQFGIDFYSDNSGLNEPNVITMQIADWEGDPDKDGRTAGRDKLLNAIPGAIANGSNKLPGDMPSGGVTFTRSGFRNGFGRATFMIHFFNTQEEAALDDPAGLNRTSIQLEAALNWMTLNGLTSQILAIWVVPRVLVNADLQNRDRPIYDGADGTPKIGVQTTTYTEDVGFEPLNSKLYRAPYRSIRAVAPDGTEHHFPIERFGSRSGNVCWFFLYNTFDDTPSQALVPADFNGYSIDYKNRLVYGAFPQLGYTLDGFLTYLSAAHQGAIMSDTAGNKAVRDTMGGTVSDISAVLGNTFNNAKSIASGSPSGGLAGNAIDASMAPGAMREAYGAANLSGSEATAVARGDVASLPFEHHRAATTADAYVAGNASNSLGTRLNQNYWETVKVTLRPEILKLYDDYFTMYGYKAGYLGVPRLVEWVAGGEEPWFGPHGSYVKTDNLKVFGIYQPAARYIADLFNAGCRFTKGF